MTLWIPKKKPLYAPMLATFGGGSLSGFKGSGGGLTPAGDFDEYGINSGDIQGVSSVFDYGYNSNVNISSLTFSTALLEAPWSTNPKQAALVTSHDNSSPTNLRPVAIYPDMGSGYSWENASSSSHFNRTAFSEGSGDTSYYDMIGGSHITDTGGTHVMCKFIQWSAQSSSDYDVSTYYAYKTSSSSAWSENNFYTLISLGSPSTRFQTAMHSTEHVTVQVGKDQSGMTSGYQSTSGQPTYVFGRRVDGTNGLGSQTFLDYYSQDNSHNTHGNSDRGVFLGGIETGGNDTSWYYIHYNHHTVNTTGSKEGFRYLKLQQSLSYLDSLTRTVGAHTSHTPDHINDNGGAFFMGNQIYPHAFICYSSDTNTPNSNLHPTHVHYVDLSGSTGVGFTKHAISQSGDFKIKYISRVGGTTAAPVFAMLKATGDGDSVMKLSINSFDVSNKTFTEITSASITDSDQVNGIWPIPNTKRIVVSKQGGFQLYEVS